MEPRENTPKIPETHPKRTDFGIYLRGIFLAFSGGWARETGIICQIGIITWKRCNFWVLKGSFSAISHHFSVNVAQKLYFIASLFL